MNKVLVIGAGIFGLDLALELVDHGFDVTICEKQNSILCGTTAQSLARVHSGLHYPRDMETARQSAKSYNIFLKKYSNYIEKGFPNFYAISRVNSKVSAKQFDVFTESLGFPFERLQNFNEYKFLNPSNFSSVYKVSEGVLNVKLLRLYFEQAIKNFNIELNLDCTVKTVAYNHKRNEWQVSLTRNEKSFLQNINSFEFYDFVIDATHSVGSFYTTKKISEFQITHMLNITCNPSEFGLTILDGDFLTALPLYDGVGKELTIYAPSISVVKRHVGQNIPEEWTIPQNLSKYFSVKSVNEALLERLYLWIPDLVDVKPVSSTTGIRCIEANVRDTDRRISEVIQSDKNFFRMVSTKIDHCVLTTAEILKNILGGKN
jgi:hypothetical protein